jgi:hypothetical protein
VACCFSQVPRRRRIVETYTTTSYSLNPDAIARHFVSVVDEGEQQECRVTLPLCVLCRLGDLGVGKPRKKRKYIA